MIFSARKVDAKDHSEFKIKTSKKTVARRPDLVFISEKIELAILFILKF